MGSHRIYYQPQTVGDSLNKRWCAFPAGSELTFLPAQPMLSLLPISAVTVAVTVIVVITDTLSGAPLVGCPGRAEGCLTHLRSLAMKKAATTYLLATVCVAVLPEWVSPGQHKNRCGTSLTDTVTLF